MFKIISTKDYSYLQSRLNLCTLYILPHFNYGKPFEQRWYETIFATKLCAIFSANDSFLGFPWKMYFFTAIIIHESENSQQTNSCDVIAWFSISIIPSWIIQFLIDTNDGDLYLVIETHFCQSTVWKRCTPCVYHVSHCVDYLLIMYNIVSIIYGNVSYYLIAGCNVNQINVTIN